MGGGGRCSRSLIAEERREAEVERVEDDVITRFEARLWNIDL